MNGKLSVVDRGRGTPIVWIHGFPLSSLVFEQQMNIPDVRHVVPDLPGFGASEPCEIHDIDDYGAALVSMLDTRKIRKAVLAGVSMGGYIVFSILRIRPELASGVILIDTRETGDSDEGRRGRVAQIEQVIREGPAFLVDAMLPKMLTPATLSLRDRRAEIVRQAMTSASSAGVKSALRAMAQRPDSSLQLKTFEGPVLVVVGSDDTLTPPDDSRRMASMARASTLVEIPNAAHLSNVERPEIFNSSVRTFLGALR